MNQKASGDRAVLPRLPSAAGRREEAGEEAMQGPEAEHSDWPSPMVGSEEGHRALSPEKDCAKVSVP